MSDTIRKMNLIDLDTVYEIEQQVHIAPWSKDILKDCILVGYDCRVIEVTNSGKPIIAGYIIARHAHYNYHILNFCIAKTLQGQGLGRQLLERVIESIVQQNVIRTTVLEARPSNHRALFLYESLGFVIVEVKKDYYKDNSSVEDALVLRKVLKHID